jgi:protease-4
MSKKGIVWTIIGGVIFLIILGGVSSNISNKMGMKRAIGLVRIEKTIEDSRDVIENLEKMRKNPFMKGMVIRIDSPGGLVVPSQEIYEEIKRLGKDNKKVVASLGTVAASGGYYIACACDKIVSCPGTMTGSIGVIMEFPNVGELVKKIGVKMNVIKSREHKDIGSPFREMTKEENNLLKGVVDDVYDQFIDAVVEGRNLKKAKVLKIADGRVLSGRQAKKLGLVDTLGTLKDAIILTGKMVGIKGEPKVIEFKKRRPRILRILERIEGLTDESIRLEYR